MFTNRELQLIRGCVLLGKESVGDTGFSMIEGKALNLNEMSRECEELRAIISKIDEIQMN